MPDTETCPACDFDHSSVLRAFRDKAPCPNCQLSHDVATAVWDAAARGATVELQRKYLDAESRATAAERALAAAQTRLRDIRTVLDREDIAW
jgi:uncharacterized protein (UPF0212 family)